MPSPPLPPADPRVYFSAERTLLSWLRLGIGIMAFGFVVARFGLFLKMIPNLDSAQQSSGFSLYVGAGLVFLGAASILLGTNRYRVFCKGLSKEEIPASTPTLAPTLICTVISILGLMLFVHLLI